MLYYTPQIWGKRQHRCYRKIKHTIWCFFYYPISAKWVLTFLLFPIIKQGVLHLFLREPVWQMSGTFGYELDIAKLTDTENSKLKKQIAAFQNIIL